MEGPVNVCLSGGAKGADLQFGMCAGTAGQSVIHWSFKGHFTQAPQTEVVILTAQQLLAADEFLVRAAPKLKDDKGKPKRYSPGRDPDAPYSFVPNLLRRNWYQVGDAERVYAVSTIKHDVVQGGTAWAVQMFIDRFDGAPCECYVFDQDVGVWFKWNGAWEPLDEPPQPSGVWAGIGTRELNPAGKAAIRNLLRYSGEAGQQV